jgi:hypothetical protein
MPMSSSDALSSMLSRPEWERIVAVEFELSWRSELESSLLLVGIDENQGERRSALELAAVLTRCGETPAMRIGEQLRNKVACLLEQGDRLRYSVSVGVAPVGARDGCYRDWIGAAEQALQAARAKGGDRAELRAF